MSKFFQRVLVCGAMILLPTAIFAQQLTNAGFEDWSGATFDGEIQPRGWNASNVEQVGFKFNFAHREAGHTGSYCMMVQDQDVGAAGITETSPGYFSLGQPWVYLESITKISQATAGTAGSINWTYRPDSMSVWIKRTGSNTDKEDFYLLYYAWSGQARGDKFKGKNGNCTSVTKYDEESDIRQELDANECGTASPATPGQICEGMWREKKTYANWTKITVPIYYFNNEVPQKMNIIFSASNYPNFRANSGLYAGNSLYVDDVELIYSSKIQKLYIGARDKEWKGFDPNSTEIQTYSLGESATSIPQIYARRGAGSLTNAHGKTATFPGRYLEEGVGKEMQIVYGDLDNTPTTITVTSEDGSSQTVYRIQFQRAPSSNATLAEVFVNGDQLADFRPAQTNYSVELPYGTTSAPVLTYTQAEDAQTVVINQASSPTGTATITVTAADQTTRKTYTFNFSVGQLKDVTLQDIKVNGKSIPGFSPSQTVYKVSLPVGTPSLLIEPVSAYPANAQTITITPNPLPTGDALHGTTVLINVSAPGATSSKTYKLNIKIEESSYSYLADMQIQGEQIAFVNPAKQDDSTQIAFNPEVTTYYVNLKMGTKELPNILYTPGDDFQSITKEEGGIDGTTRITVLAGNNSDQTVYKLVFSTAKSEISTLAGVEVGGEPLDGFSPDITNYSYELPIGTTTLPTINPIAHDEFQEISVTTGGLNGKTRISVTAGNGNTTNYYIAFSVKKYDDNTLKSLSVGPYYSLQDETFNPIAFDPQRNDYYVKLEKDSLPTIQYELQSPEFQDTVVIYPSSANGKYKITVRPRNGLSRTYTIQFVYKKSDNVALQMIYISDTIKHTVVNLPGFEPDKTDYTFTLDTGATVMPDILYDKAEASQVVTKTWDATNKRVVRIAVVAESGAKRTYKIKFIVPSAASTQLNRIMLVEDGDTIPLPGFKKDVYEYTYSLHTETCPMVLAVKAVEDQQVTITAPYAAGVATVLVKMEESTSEYTIDFVRNPAATVQLNSILINDNPITGFSPTQLNYTGFTYRDTLPNVKGIVSDATVELRWKGNTAYLNVQDTIGNKAIYSVEFTREYSDINTLEGIYADGVVIDGFVKTTLNYSYNLPAGSAYPTLTYKASENAEVVSFGQVADGKWEIAVRAENDAQQKYSVQYTIAKYNDATLVNLVADTFALTPAFNSNTFTYNVNIDEGAELPKLTVETRSGQTIMQNNVSDVKQQIIVFAESGANNTYTINYHRKQSSNALLKDILINGASLAGFDPAVENYVDSLERNATVVSNVFPIGQLSNQTITTYFSRPDGVTRIHVEAQDGSTKDYSIAFPLKKSSNSFLGDLYLNSEDVEIKFKPTTTDYTVILPYEATECPKMVYEPAENEPQRIDVISRSIGDTSKIIVTAEDGSARTYNILFTREVLKTANTLQAIYITLDNDPDTEFEFKKPKTLRDTVLAVPFGTRRLDVRYEKMYPEQTVFVQPGGVKEPTIITVKANNDTVADVVYRIIPSLATSDPATLTDIRVKVGDGEEQTIAGFNPEKFSYIVQVSGKPKLRYTLTKGAEISIIDQTSKHWSAEVTYGNRTNTYHVWYYYKDEQIPNAEFTSWTSCATYTSAQKPTGWNTIADVLGTHGVFSPGTLVSKPSAGVVELQTQYSWTGGGMIPGFITLGDVSGNWGVAGSSSFGISGGIPFHNSPDEIIFNYKLETVSTKNQIQYILTGSDGTKTLEWNESATSSSYKDYKYSLKEANQVAGEPTTLNILINSYKQIDGTIVAAGANMLVERILLTYNHTLTGLKVDAINAAKSGNAFTATLTDAERIEKPVLSFTGEVADQAQNVTWNTPTKDANFETRTATIRNYAENGTDYTDYTLTVKRPLDSVNVLRSILVGGDTLKTFTPETINYTVTIPASQRNLPDVQPIPASSLQTVTTAYNEVDSTMTITVTSEKGATKVYIVKFVTKLSNDVTLKTLTAEGVTYDPEVTSYDITAERLPLISFEKNSDLQKVSLINGVLTVTAEDGVTTGTITINRLDPVITPNGTISEFEADGNPQGDFGGDEVDKEAAKPDYISFKRAQATDSVVFVQAPDMMTWSVPGTMKIYTWSYPTGLSDNAFLKMITINGENYDKFMKDELNYELTSDSTIVLVAEPAEAVQQLTTTFDSIAGGVLYTTTVTPQSGAHKTYTIKITHPLDSLATLQAIFLDSTLIDGFAPDKFNYTVTLPIAAGAKIVQPKMPNLTYIAGHKGQTITVVSGELNVEGTTIKVQSEDGNANAEYTVTILAQKSSCSNLTGITVNGVALDHFEPGRHHYSTSLATSDIDVDYTTDDRFQTITTNIDVIKVGHEFHYTLHVVAEDGSYSDYLVEIYVENQSNDAQLANILLNGKSMDKFEPLYNSDIVYDGGNNNYEIKLPASSKLPEVSAQLKMNGQQVSIEHRRDEHMNIDSTLLIVTAVDSVTTNTYVLRFVRPLSTNSQLSLIEINNEPIEGFDPNNYFYAYDMKSDEEKPRITVETADENATYSEPDYSQEGRVTITVYAQDYEMDKNHKSIYTIAVNIKKSEVATLDMIYQGRDSLPGFNPNMFYYAYELESNETFPDLSWQDPDIYPIVSPIDTVENDPIARKLVRQIRVTAEDSTISNVYTIAYTIRKSDVDTLQMIFIGSKPMPNFKADSLEYEYKLTAAEVVALDGEMPQIDPIPGEEGTQKIETLPVRDNYGVKTIGYKHVVTVTAAAGNSRTYTVHYPRELSDDATLKMIFIDESPLTNFDAERNSYKIDIDYAVPVPNVTELAKDFQTVKHNQHGDTVEIIVTAELETVQNVYTIVFERRKSNVTTLRNVIFMDENEKQLPYDMFAFQPQQYDYTIEMPYVAGDSIYALPDITIIKEDSFQVVSTSVDVIAKTQKMLTVRVVAPNGEDEGEYKFFFQFARNNDADLKDLKVGGKTIKNFQPTTLDYKYVHPYGSDSTDFITNANVQELVTFVKSDPEATDELFVAEDASIIITITAQDGKSQNTYSIQQIIGKDTVNTLDSLFFDGEPLIGFESEQTFYTYFLKSGASASPAVYGVTTSKNAKVDATQDDPKVGAVNDTLKIYVEAQDGSERIYSIYFVESSINEAQDPTGNDVIAKCLSNTELFVGTIRKDVYFALFDEQGHRLYYANVPTADPNDVVIVNDLNNKEILTDVVNSRSGLVINIIPGKIYFYTFLCGDKTIIQRITGDKAKKLKSGKLITRP